MISTDVMRELQLYAGFPLFVFTVVLCSSACVLVFLAGYYISSNGRCRLTSATSFVKAALIKFNWPLWVSITTVLFLIPNHLLVRGLAVGIWDVDGVFFPYQVLVADYARIGRLIHWDPWSNAGRSILGDPQLGIFSPVNFIIGLLTGGTSSGFIFYWLLMWWLGGFGMLMLARHLKAPSWGACVVALGFLFCGAYTGHAEHTPFITAFSFLPLIIWRLDSALRTHQFRPAIEAGALWGLSALAGYPGLTIITGCFSALWAVGRWLFAEPSGTELILGSTNSTTKMVRRPPFWFAFSTLALVLVVGLVVLSPTYVAFFVEGAGTNARVGALSRERAIVSNALHPGALWTFASPYLTIVKFYDQMNGKNNLWPYTDVSSASIYAGAIISVLALCALLRQPRDRWRWWLLGLGLVSVACALGQALPLRGWLYDWFYPMRFFRHAAIFRLYYLFALSVLAAVATCDLAVAFRCPTDRTWTTFFAASTCVASCALLVFMASANYASDTGKIIFLLSYVHALWIWLGICGVAFSMWLLRNGLRSRCLPILMLALAGSDAFLTSTLSRQTVISTRPEDVKRWASLDERHSAVLDLTVNGLLREDTSCYPNPPCKLLKSDQLITKVPVFNSYATGESYFHYKMIDHPILKEMSIGTERVWFSKHVSQVVATERNFAAFVRRAETLGAPPLVVHSPEELLRRDVPSKEDFFQRTGGDGSEQTGTRQVAQINELPAAEKATINLVRYLPDELSFNVWCPTDGWLLVTDRWARSWQAEVNGRPTTVYGGNFIFRAVHVSAGQNNIKFTYHPFGFPWLVVFSWGTLAVVACYSVYSAVHRRTAPSPKVASEV